MSLAYEQIQDRAMSRIPATIDRREGSVAYDAIAPSAYEMSEVYKFIEWALDQTFAGTAERDWLIKCCAEVGITPRPATYAVRKGVFNPASLEIRLGERFNFEDLNYMVVSKIEDGVYEMQCETLGVVGNLGTGLMTPIQYIQGLESAELTSDVLIYAEDEEPTEELRARYFATLPTMTLDGNVAQYDKWCREFSGIGNFKIFPLWGRKMGDADYDEFLNTVKVSILSSENTKASQTLIDDFQEYLDPKSEGLGMGKAPIGAVVTVSTAEEVVIDVSAKVMLRVGYNEPLGIEEELYEYLNSLNYVRNTVSYVAISAVINNNASVEVPLEVMINGKQENVTLGDEQIAKLGKVTIEVIQ